MFEREWRIPQDTDAQRLLDDVLGFLLDALTIALDEDMPRLAGHSCTRPLKSFGNWLQPKILNSTNSGVLPVTH